MNFDFLKNTRELGYVYENCSNAEKLAMTMPVQSIFTSRKSAELLAKLIYMAAHNQQMGEMTFADILADRVVRDFIRSRDIMDAFHFIRKNGNRAVHEDTQWDVDDALDVLQDLHYITGETACMLGLIQDYPQFDDNIGAYPDAKYDEDDRIAEKAQEMFCAYLEEHNAAVEREKYDTPSLDELISYSITGDIIMHERLTFERKPKQKAVVEYIQKYFAHLLRLSIARSADNDPEIRHPVVLRCVLELSDGKIVTTNDMDAFLDAMSVKLPVTDGFSLDISCSGIVRELFSFADADGNGEPNLLEQDSIWTGAGMLDMMEFYKRRERFDYKLAIFYPDSGEYRYEKVLNGQTVDLDSKMTADIVTAEVDGEWNSEFLDIVANFDFEKHPRIMEQLHACVRQHIPKSELEYCEETWEDGEPGILLSSIQWNTCNLHDVQIFLDEINEILAPIADTVDADSYGHWEIPSEFALAKCQWTGTKFELVGVQY